MNTSTLASLHPVRQTLLVRQAELRNQLHSAAEAAVHSGDQMQDVQDFKDFAAAESRAVVDEVAIAHAAKELNQIAAALRRLDAGSYGECEQCGETIAEARLRALPATGFCTACQMTQERSGLRR